MASFEDAVLATGGDSWNTWQVASLGGAEFVASWHFPSGQSLEMRSESTVNR